MDLLNTKKNIVNPILVQDAETLAKNHNCAEYIPITAIQEEAGNQVYFSVMSNVVDLIGENLELQNLIGKNIVAGKRIFSHPTFLQNLKDNSFFKD